MPSRTRPWRVCTPAWPARCYLFSGQWDEAERLCTELLDAMPDRPGGFFLHNRLAHLCARRGRLDEARQELAQLEGWATADEVQVRGMFSTATATVALAA